MLLSIPSMESNRISSAETATHFIEPTSLFSSQTPDGNVTTYGNDAAGNLTSVTQPDNSKLMYSYDAAHQGSTAKRIGQPMNIS
jgi:YD repeat-containing protein